MYACILIPRELSLVLTLHPNPMHVLEMSATVWSNAHLPPGTVFYPDEGEVRLDRLENRTVLRDDDVRRVYGCYDAIMNINGQEVRHCNWVRFVKTTNDPENANVISSKVRGQAFFQVTRPIKPNEEIVVLFHLTAEKSLYDRMSSSPYVSSSPTLGPHMSYPDLHASLLLRQHENEEKTGMLTSTPVSMTTGRKDSNMERLQGQGRSLTFGSSSSSSSFASPFLETPRTGVHKKRNIPAESSFSSPMFTSSCSSRETTASDDHQGEVTFDASSTKGDNDLSDPTDTRDQVSATSESENHDNILKRENVTKDSDKSDELKVDESDISDNSEDNGEVKESIADSTNDVSASEDVGMDLSDSKKKLDNKIVESLCTADDDLEAGRDGSSNVCGQSDEEEPAKLKPNSNHSEQGEVTKPTTDEQVTSSSNLSKSVQYEDKFHSQMDQPNIMSQGEDDPSKTNSQSKMETQSEPGANDTDQSQPPFLTASYSFNQSVGLSRIEDMRTSETDNVFSSPNENRPFPYQFPGSPKSARSLDIPSRGELEHPPIKRCRERTWWPCDVCGKKFDRPSLLKRHTRTHTGEKPHACDVCGKAFSTSSSLNTHRRIHSGEKPHQCKICGKRFTASSNLYYHRMTHNKEKPHKCDLCSKSFPTPGDLRSHMYIHNGSWPFRCEVCNRGFSKQTNLKNHMLLHSGDKPHECPRCGKKFALSCNLKTHLKTHENSDSSDSTECMKCGIALENPEELRQNLCKRCMDTSRRILPKPSSMSSSSSATMTSTIARPKRHTDFSISKLTSSDVKKNSETDDVKSEKPFNLVMPSIAPSKLKSMTSSGFMPTTMTSYPQDMPPVYRQFFASALDQNRWFVPNPSPHLLSAACIPAQLKQQGGLQGNTLKTADSHAQQQAAMTKFGTPSPAHSVLPAFITPEMMSLRGGGVFPSSIPALPPGFAIHPGSGTWGGPVIAQGF